MNSKSDKKGNIFMKSEIKEKQSRIKNTKGTNNMYRAGIIGCGWIASAHMNGCRSIPDKMEVVAAADLAAEKLKLFGENWNIRGKGLYNDYRDLLKNESLDVLSICTPAISHAEIVREALRYSPKAIVCEKPIALSLKEADEMMSMCKSANCELIICHQRRFEKRYVKARELISSGTIGEIISVSTFSGDLFEDGTHAIDLMRYLVGDKKVKSVIGQVDFGNKQKIYGHLRDYAAIGHISFEDNSWGIIMTEEMMKRCKVIGSLGVNIVGTKGMLEISGGNYPSPGWLNIKTKDRWETCKSEVEDKLLGVPPPKAYAYFWLEPFGLIMKSVIETIETGKENICRAENGRAAIEVVIAIHESARQRKLINFPVEVSEKSPVLEEKI